MSVLARHHVVVSGPPEATALVFAHGFGCDQSMWRLVAPVFEDRYRVVLFDHIGCGAADSTDYDPVAYASLSRYAEDVLAICRELELRDVVVVGHSVSAMVAVLAQIVAPDLIAALVLLGPSACYVDDGDYAGGFTRPDIDDLLELLDSNHLGWQAPLADMVMAGTDRPELTAELEESFCRTDPDIARQFAEVTFLGDNREDLQQVSAPTLVVQSASDAIAPLSAGEFVRDHIPGARFALIDTVGHCPHLSAPGETIDAIEAFLCCDR
ncbi:MAG: alpha/beta hydrolase [Nocardioides sp.]